jgi:tetratricopeptide (TPR) repeat protein
MAGSGARVPRHVAGVDLTKLPLSPLEGFVVSRIDGLASIELLADLTSLDEAQIQRILERLIELGAVEWARESVSLPKATGRAPTRTPSAGIVVPDSLRSPPKLDVPRPSRPPAPPRTTEHVYKSTESPEEHVDPMRRKMPSIAPVASHTGALHPAGEVEYDMGTADTVPPPAPEPIAAFLSEPPADPPPRVRIPSRTFAAPRAPTSSKPPAAPVLSSAPPPGPSTPPREPFVTGPPPASSPVSAPRSSTLPTAPPPPETSSAPAAIPDQRATISSTPPAEELDLDADRRKRIDDLYFALDLLDHYAVLGVKREAAKDEVRSAYFQLSKVFHPDTMFRKRLGSYKAKMEAIFKRLTEAYEVLGKKRGREEYDRYLALLDQTRAVEAVVDVADVERPLETAPSVETAAVEPAAPEPAAPEPAAPEPAAPEPAPPMPREMSEDAKARARELMRRKLLSATKDAEAQRVRHTAPPETPVIAERPPPADPKQILRSLTSSLKSTAALTGGLDQLQRHLASAKRAEQHGDTASAARELRLAMALAPDREDVRREHARVSTVLLGSLATSYEEQALYEQRHGKWAAAAISWAKVFQGRPEDARAARLAAEALVEAQGDLHRAKELAQRAAELAPDDVGNLRALARVYMAAGLPLNARRVLQHAATLDPKDEMVENLLRDLDRLEKQSG